MLSGQKTFMCQKFDKKTGSKILVKKKVGLKFLGQTNFGFEKIKV